MDIKKWVSEKKAVKVGLDDPAVFNALLEEEFEDKFSEYFDNSNEDEKYFLTIHKYCLRNQYVDSYRKRKYIKYFNRALYSGLVKFNGYFTLTFKIFLNLFLYFLITPLFNFSASNIKSKKILREVHLFNLNEINDDTIYYPGSIKNFLSYYNKVESIFKLKHIIYGFKRIRFAKLSFVFGLSKIFCGNKINIYFPFSIIIFFPLYSLCKEMLTNEHNVLHKHYTYGAVIAPQKIFALHFLKQNKESIVISHGNFHDPQCSYQPASSFIDLGGVKNDTVMGCNRYFSEDLLINPSLPIKFQARNCDYNSLSDVLNGEQILAAKSSLILVFSSTYDPGIGRDPYYGLISIIRLLREHGLKNLKIKLHPSESSFFFQILYFIEFNQFPQLIDNNIDFSQFDIAFGMPSTFICAINDISKIYVYSPIEYLNFDYVHKENVKYFSKII